MNDWAHKLHAEFIKQKKTVAFAESCTGGALATSLTLIPDASLFFKGSIVVYSEEWKRLFLGVKAKEVVSRQAVEEMVEALFEKTNCDYAVAVSGILGPSGGTEKNPIGTVYVAIGKKGERIDTGVIHAPKDRVAGIEFTVQMILQSLFQLLSNNQKTFNDIRTY